MFWPLARSLWSDSRFHLDLLTNIRSQLEKMWQASRVEELAICRDCRTRNDRMAHYFTAHYFTPVYEKNSLYCTVQYLVCVAPQSSGCASRGAYAVCRRPADRRGRAARRARSAPRRHTRRRARARCAARSSRAPRTAPTRAPLRTWGSRATASHSSASVPLLRKHWAHSHLLNASCKTYSCKWHLHSTPKYCKLCCELKESSLQFKHCCRPPIRRIHGMRGWLKTKAEYN